MRWACCKPKRSTGVDDPGQDLCSSVLVGAAGVSSLLVSHSEGNAGKRLKYE